MKPLRILQIQTFLRSEKVNPRAGGKSRVSLMLTRYLLEAGHEVGVYPWPERLWGETVPFAASPKKAASVFPTLALPPIAQGVIDSIRLFRTKFPARENRSQIESLFFLEGLRIALRRFQPDILHCHQTVSDIPSLLRILGKTVPVILTHHSGRHGQQVDIYDRIIFLSRAMQEEVCRGEGYPLKRSRVLYYPVADDFLHGDVIPAEKRSGIVSVGGLKDAKGIDLLLEVWRRNDTIRKIPLVLCGAGPDEEKYKDFVRRHNLPVQFRGRRTVEEIQAEVSNALLLVNPSRMEGFSVAILEALTCGTPVIGWAEQVKELEERWHRSVGFPFDARSQSAEELEALILRALQSPILESRSREEISGLARDSFSMQRYGAEMIELYDQLRKGG
jgi:glycosyltransferase involved in cell wall biosynthesis